MTYDTTHGTIPHDALHEASHGIYPSYAIRYGVGEQVYYGVCHGFVRRIPSHNPLGLNPTVLRVGYATEGPLPPSIGSTQSPGIHGAPMGSLIMHPGVSHAVRHGAFVL